MPALLGRYELLRPIAKGGMATVYLARVVGEGGFERLVAVKLMHPHIAGEQDFVSMFLDEARLAARIRHPNVVPTLAIERGPEGLFLVMEFVDGLPLNTVIRSLAKERRPFPTEIALRIMIDALEGLHAAHELVDESGSPLHLVHRDVSPQNVLVGKDGVSRITDFGVAHARSRLVTTQGSALKGKVAYLSPEQIASGQVDRRADLYAAGIVLFEALTLKRLFKGETEGETMAQVLAGPKRPPHAVVPTVPREISDVCMLALAVHPEERFQTALEMIEALEEAARQADIGIAGPRQVGAFLATLNAPEPSIDAKLPSSSGISSFHSGAVTGSAVIPMVSSTPAPSAAPRRRGLLFALGATGVLGLIAAVAIGAYLRSPSAEPPTLASGAGAAAPAPSTNPEPSRQPKAPAPAPIASTAEPSASAAPQPSEAATSPRPKKSAAGKPTAERPKGGAGYRPDEL